MISSRGVMKFVQNYTYNTNNIIGQGCSSIVYLGNSLLNSQLVAIRVVTLKDKDAHLRSILENQIAVLNSLPSHPNIIKLLAILRTQNHVYMVTQYCESKLELSEKSDINSIASGIIQGLKHLYKNRVIHRDIKPDNIMMKNGVPKIIDFGFAKKMHSNQQINVESLGTPVYMSPQILECRPYTSKSDVWSLGATLYQLLYKRLPFNAQSEMELLFMVKSTTPSFPFVQTILSKIIKGCLIADEGRRFSWEQIFSLASQIPKRQSMCSDGLNYIQTFPLGLKRRSSGTESPRMALRDNTNRTIITYVV